MTKQHECHVFTIWGCLLGVDLPIGLAMLYDFFIYQAYLHKEALFPSYVHGLFVIVMLLAGIGPYYAQVWYFTKPNHEKKIDYFLYGVGFLTCLLIGVIIMLTGGILRSLFSFYLIYLPSIVAIAFAKTKQGLVILCGTAAMMIFIGLKWEFLPKEYMDFYGSASFKIGCFIIAIIQLMSIIKLERKERTA